MWYLFCGQDGSPHVIDSESLFVRWIQQLPVIDVEGPFDTKQEAREFLDGN